MRDYSKWIVIFFFTAFLFVGLCVYKDYGIQWDEQYSMNKGQMTFDYIIKMDNSQFQYFDYYGTIFDAFTWFIQEALGVRDSRDQYLLKHLITFLSFYISVVFFYLLAKNHFRSWKIGLLGSLFLIVSPRIFADAFYNPKDIPCLSLFIISFYTLIRYLDKKTFTWASWHALASALVINTRITGILVPFFTLAFSMIELLRFKTGKVEVKRFLGSLTLYLPLTIFLTVLFWPTLWKDPWNQFMEAFKQMSHFPWDSHVLYMGEYKKASELPWHYLTVWILISTPILYIVFCVTGLHASVKSLCLKSVSFSFKRDTVIFLLWFFTPLLIVIILDSIVYDIWRQVFFIYPGFLMIALAGIRAFIEMIRSFSRMWVRRITNTAFILILALGLFEPLSFMVKYHPFQNMYFNSLIGGIWGAKFAFEMDYWGVSYRKALEYILKSDPGKEIKLWIENKPGLNNSWILPPEERKRLIYVKENEGAQYFLSNYRYHEEDYSFPNEFYSIVIDGVKIMVVYKLNQKGMK